jgi:hypothetical protein
VNSIGVETDFDCELMGKNGEYGGGNFHYTKAILFLRPIVNGELKITKKIMTRNNNIKLIHKKCLKQVEAAGYSMLKRNRTETGEDTTIISKCFMSFTIDAPSIEELRNEQINNNNNNKNNSSSCSFVPLVDERLSDFNSIFTFGIFTVEYENLNNGQRETVSLPLSVGIEIDEKKRKEVEERQENMEDALTVKTMAIKMKMYDELEKASQHLLDGDEIEAERVLSQV